jgi:DNA-binding beta-propeller fold protein YncE
MHALRRFRSVHWDGALIASVLAVSCASPAASPAPTVAPSVAAATVAPSAAATPCPAPTVAPTVAPGAGTAAPTLLPLIPENTNGCVRLSKVAIPPIAGKTASIDILDIDQQTHLLYVTDRTDNGIDIFDVSTPIAKYVKTVDVGSGPNGVVVAKNVNKVFAALNDSNVAIIDIASGSATLDTVVAKVSTGGKKRADELDYDPKDKKIYVANSDDGIVTVIDATTNKILKKFEGIGDALEQPRYDSADGMMYMTSSDQNAVFQFDPTKDVLVKKFDVGTKCNPNGIAINPTTNQALLGCSSRSANVSVVWDLTNGKVISTFDQAGAGDAVVYSAAVDRFIFAASNFNRGAAMAIFAGNPVKFLTNVETAVGSHGVAFDETNKIVYTQDQLPNEGALFSFQLPQ